MWLQCGLGRVLQRAQENISQTVPELPLYGSAGVLFTHFTFKHITCVGGHPPESRSKTKEEE